MGAPFSMAIGVLGGALLAVFPVRAAPAEVATQKKLFIACQESDLQKFDEAIRQSGDVDAKNSEGKTALCFAVRGNANRAKEREEIVRRLLEMGANPNISPRSGDAPLLQAISSVGANGIVELLVAHGADVNAASYTNEGPALSRAASSYDVDMVGLLLRLKADPSIETSRKMTPLMFALGGEEGRYWPSPTSQQRYQKAFETVKCLLDAGADVQSGDRDGRTALHYAAMTNDLKIIAEIAGRTREKTAVTSKGWNALHYAVSSDRRCDVDALAFIIKNCKLSVNSQDEAGDTALHIAARRGNDKAVVFLLLNGADPSIRNKQGRLATDDSDDLSENTQEMLEKYSPSLEPEATPAPEWYFPTPEPKPLPQA